MTNNIQLAGEALRLSRLHRLPPRFWLQSGAGSEHHHQRQS